MRATASILAILLVACSGGNGSNCTVGTAGCECTPGGLCDSPATCQGGVCVNPAVDTGTDSPVDTAGDTAADDVVGEVECSSDGDCDDSNPCTVDSCDLDYNECVHDPVDADGDGYPAMEVGGSACTGGTDCDDGDGDVHPDATLDCTGGGDFDCDGDPDDDEDGDGYVTSECGGDDCDDGDAAMHPGVLARDCTGGDMDCNGRGDQDNDGDTHAAVTCGGADCDDENPTAHPGIAEVVCNGQDDDCNGEMSLTEDADLDGWPNDACAPAGAQVDCDDASSTVNPAASEICDAVDQDCDGSWADGGADDDLDGVLDEACGGADCSDMDATIMFGALEACDGVDQDCDGQSDEPGPSGADVRLSGPGKDSAADARVVWTGSEFGVIWSDVVLYDESPSIYFARVSSSGTKIGSDRLLTFYSYGESSPSLAWTGSEFGVGWTQAIDPEGEAVRFVRISAIGDRIGSELQVDDGGLDSSRCISLAWTGTEYGAAWRMSTNTGSEWIDFTRISATGGRLGSVVPVTGPGDLSCPAFAWTGSEFGLAWTDLPVGGSTEVYFVRTSPAGIPIGSAVGVTEDSMYPPYDVTMAWAGSAFGIAWSDGRDANQEIYFTIVSAGGVEAGSEVRLSSSPGSSNDVSLLWNGNEYMLAWTESATGDSDIYTLPVTSLGSPEGVADRFTTDPAWSFGPWLAWTGSEYGVVWSDDRDGVDAVFFNTLRHCP